MSYQFKWGDLIDLEAMKRETPKWESSSLIISIVSLIWSREKVSRLKFSMRSVRQNRLS